MGAILFSHVSPLLEKGYIEPLSPSDIPPLPEDLSARATSSGFALHVAEEFERSPDDPSMAQCLYRFAACDYGLAFCLICFAEGLTFVGPVLTTLVTKFLSDQTIPMVLWSTHFFVFLCVCVCVCVCTT